MFTPTQVGKDRETVRVSKERKSAVTEQLGLLTARRELGRKAAQDSAFPQEEPQPLARWSRGLLSVWVGVLVCFCLFIMIGRGEPFFKAEKAVM